MFKGGQSNPTWLPRPPDLCDAGQARPHGQLLPSAHAIEREFAVMSGLAGTDVPGAAHVCLCEDESIIGAPSTSWSSCRAACSGTSPARHEHAERAPSTTK